MENKTREAQIRMEKQFQVSSLKLLIDELQSIHKKAEVNYYHWNTNLNKTKYEFQETILESINYCKKKIELDREKSVVSLSFDKNSAP